MTNKENHNHIGRIAINTTSLALLTVLSFAAISPTYATINCAGFLPSRYFERIENNKPFAGKLAEKTDGTQQLQDLNGNIITDNLSDAYILMDKYVVAQKNGKYGVVNAAGKIIMPFNYDDIHTEPDIGTSFIVSVKSLDGDTKQGIINRDGDWIYTLANAYIKHAHSDSDSDSDSDYDQDYFLVTDNVATNHKGLTGLLDDRGYWAVMPQYEVINPLNPCTGQPLYSQVSLQNKTGLIDQNSNIIIPFLANQHIESFNNNISPLLFLRSSLGDIATAMSDDIQEYIVSAEIIDADDIEALSSEVPIRKLLYHQLYTFKQAGKYGVINYKGEVILEPQFDSYRDEADKVWVEKNGKMIDLNTLTILD